MEKNGCNKATCPVLSGEGDEIVLLIGFGRRLKEDRRTVAATAPANDLEGWYLSAVLRRDFFCKSLDDSLLFIGKRARWYRHEERERGLIVTHRQCGATVRPNV